MNHRLFDVSRIKLLPLEQRDNDLHLDVIRPLEPMPDKSIHPGMAATAESMVRARQQNAPVILMMGGHVLRAGVQRYIIDLMERGLVTCLAMNGAVMIHDFEFALMGATTESVARYIKDGRFGLWDGTGRINDIVNQAYAADPNAGMGASVGRVLTEQDYPHAHISLLAAAWRCNVPATVHIGIGYDIIHQHPNFNGAASGALSYNDFLAYTAQISELEGGLVMNFGSAVMGPEVYLKALSMARNVAAQENREIKRFTTLVCDLRDLPESVDQEPSKSSAQYYFRPWKTMLVRTVAEGGQSRYVRGRHEDTIPALWTAADKLIGTER